MDENTNVDDDDDDDDHEFASIGNKDWFGQNQSWKNISFSYGETFSQKENIFHMCFHVQNNMPSLIIDYGSCAIISSTTCRRATLNDKLVF
jgi:hypothetical protein